MKNRTSPLVPSTFVLAAGLAALTFAQRGPAPAALPYPGGLVPFVAESAGGLANSAAAGSANPVIVIESNGSAGHFLINSILVESDASQTGFVALSVNGLEIDGVEYETRTRSIVGGIDGSGVVESADLMGTPIRVTSLGAPDAPPGGSFPREIIAQNGGFDDVRIEFFARSDSSDLDISKIRVTGWKLPTDEISVGYVPGN